MKLLALSVLLCALMTVGRGWTKIGDRYFVYVHAYMTWSQAEQNCRQRGGYLASVHSVSEYHQIQSLIRRSSYYFDVTWIGGNDLVNEGVWRWSDRTSFNYDDWCWGEPNNSFNQDCLQINYSSNKCWDDMWCYYSRPSVCVSD